MSSSLKGLKAKVKGSVTLKSRGRDRLGAVEKPKLPRAASLLAWYDRHKRVMPWRATGDDTVDPYRVWLSEIMLQQTSVATVGPYFLKFIDRWPTIDTLADASLDDVLRQWAGLGYYRRARMLHQCAQTIRKNFKSVLPNDEATLRTLPGFGPYTAAAVSAIAFGHEANVVDGNVERVISRIFAVTEPLPHAKGQLARLARTLVPTRRCGDYAQALMDLGATICTPRTPKCPICPWRHNCRAYALGVQASLPIRTKAKQNPVKRAMAFVLRNKKGEIYLQRRPSEGLLGGMMEVPSSPWQESEIPQLTDALAAAPAKVKWILRPSVVSHIFSHFTLEIAVAVGETPKPLPGIWVAVDALDREALPTVMKKIVHHALK